MEQRICAYLLDRSIPSAMELPFHLLEENRHASQPSRYRYVEYRVLRFARSYDA